MSKTLDRQILEIAANNFENDPETWIQNVMARTSNGVEYVDPEDPEAAAWCTHGMIVCIAHTICTDPAIAENVAEDAMQTLLSANDWASHDDLYKFNDAQFDNGPLRTVKEIIELLRNAAQTASRSSSSN